MADRTHYAAYSSALRALAKIHRDEFDELYQQERVSCGLLPSHEAPKVCLCEHKKIDHEINGCIYCGCPIFERRTKDSPSFRLPRTLYNQVMKQAKRENQSLVGLIRYLLQRHLDELSAE